jgi:peptidoglycan/xylan/chitin deacetylase (PgdA/CDA1 family)
MMSDRLILMYHRITELDADPWALAVTPGSFADQLEAITSSYEVVPLRDVLSQPDRTTRHGVILTFDDGYADNLAAARMLAARGLAATYFLAAGQVGSAYEFWWDEIARIFLDHIALPETLDLKLEEDRLQLDLGKDGPEPGDPSDDLAWRADQGPRTIRQRAYLDTYGVVRQIDSEQRDRALQALAEWAGLSRETRPGMRALALEEVAELSMLEGAEVGAHTLTHPVLSSLPAERQREEIVGSRRLLEEVTGSPVESFAYPHGSPTDYTTETVAIVRDAGLLRACAAVGGSVGARASALELPRLMVEDWDGAELERRITEAFAHPQ